MDWFTEAEVKEAVEALPEQFRMAVLLADVEGFSYKEIAEILDIPIGTVMSRLHRGRKALQKPLYEFAVRRGLADDDPIPMHRPDVARDGRPRCGRQRRLDRRPATDCNEALRELYEYLDGELTDDARRIIAPAPRRLRAVLRGLRLRGRAAQVVIAHSAATRCPRRSRPGRPPAESEA